METVLIVCINKLHKIFYHAILRESSWLLGFCFCWRLCSYLPISIVILYNNTLTTAAADLEMQLLIMHPKTFCA